MVFLRKVNRWVLLFYGTEETVNTPEADRAKVLEQLTDQICLILAGKILVLPILWRDRGEPCIQ